MLTVDSSTRITLSEGVAVVAGFLEMRAGAEVMFHPDDAQPG